MLPRPSLGRGRSEAYTVHTSPASLTVGVKTYSQANPTFHLQYDVLMMRCSVIIYKSLCHFVIYLSFSCSPCCYCVPCSCVRPGIQCGLSVRGTFRVSQTVPAPCAPSHCLASCCGCLWGLLQPAASNTSTVSLPPQSDHYLPNRLPLF